MTSLADVEAFKKHALWEALALAVAGWAGSKPNSSTDRQTIDRVLVVLRYCEAFRLVPSGLFPQDRVNQANYIQQQVANLRSLWNGWDEGDPLSTSEIAQLDSTCDQILSYLHSFGWPSLQKESRARIFREAAEAYADSVEKSLDAFAERLRDLESQARQRELQLAKFGEDVGQLSEQGGEALAEIEETRDAQAVNAQEQLRIELRKINENAQLQFEDRGKKFKALLDDHSERGNSALLSLEADASRGKELLQIVGDQSQAEGYLKFANSEQRSYRLWVSIGSGVVIATAVYLGVEFNQLLSSASGGDPSPAVIIFKSALSLTGLAFSGFAFREAGKRQRQSLDARYRALDLLALRPYTYGMDDVDAKVLRAMLGERLFKSPPEATVKRPDERVTTFRIDLGDIKTAAETARIIKDVSGT